MNEVFTPIMWDVRKNGFFPVECLDGANYPLMAKEKCESVCSEMNKVVRSFWNPRKGETYWHPCTWMPDKGFIPMDCSVTFEKSAYPAFRSERECLKVCNELNKILVA